MRVSLKNNVNTEGKRKQHVESVEYASGVREAQEIWW